MEKAYRALSTLFKVVCILALLVLVSLNGTLLAPLLAAAVVYVLFRHPIGRRATLFLFLFALAIQLISLLLFHPPIESDFSVMYNGALSLVQGDTSVFKYGYFARWAYQTAFSLYEAALLLIWNSPLFLRLVSALFSAGIVALVYRLIKPTVRPFAAQSACVLLSVFPFFATLSTVLTNQMSSAFFLLLGVWLMVSPDTGRLRFWRFPLAGVALCVGNLLRPDGIIVLVALVVWAVFSILRDKKQLFTLALGTAVVLVLYLGLGALADRIVRASGLNPNGLDNLFPLWKFVCGLNHSTAGRYAEADFALIMEHTDSNKLPTDETVAFQLSLIKERLSVPLKDLILLFFRKNQTMWGATGLGWATRYLTSQSSVMSTLLTGLTGFERGLFWLSSLLGAVGLFKKGRTPTEHLPYFAFFAAFVAYLFIEVQPRYAYLPQLFLFAAAAYGIDLACSRLERHRSAPLQPESSL